MKRGRWTLAVGGILVAALVVGRGCSQTAVIFPAPPQGREPAYPDNLVRTPGATFLYFEGKKVVAYFHGNGEDLADSVPMVSLLRSLGMGVLAVEYPGYGIAGGSPSERAAYGAAESALLWLRSEKGIGPERVVLLGQSLGTAVASEMASRGFGARLVLISPFTSVTEMAWRTFPLFPASFIRHPFDTEAKAPAITLPVLIIHGTEDDVVPFAMGERLARGFPHAQLIPIAGGEHNDLLSMHAIPMREALSPFLRF